MNLLNKNIWIYILVGVFLQPHIFNNLHFSLIAHDHIWKFENSEKNLFKSKNRFHNCEQYLFKTPPLVEISFIKEIIANFTFEFEEIEGNEIKTFVQSIEFTHLKRGPPELIQIT